MHHITDDIIDETFQSKPSGGFWRGFFIILSVVLAAFFVGETLFGKNSFEVYLQLQEDEKKFKAKIEQLQEENAALQKQYFELGSLLPKQDQP